jgi:hypothetical protein
MFERDHSVTRVEQAAASLGVSLAQQQFNPNSSYGRREWSTEGWSTNDGKHLIISGDRDGFDAVVLGEYEYPCTAYDRESEQIELARRAGLGQQPINE